MKLLTILFTFILFIGSAQDDKGGPTRPPTDLNSVDGLIAEAIYKMDNGDIKASLKLLKKAKKMEPKNILVDYETAFADGLDKNFKKAISTCEKMTKHPDIFARVYQMLGNNYDYNGYPEKAIAAYERGMIIFPKSGPLYLERGNMEMMQNKVNEALGYYLKGIEVDPNHSSNYYWTAKIYMDSDDSYLGLIYGEFFMNLERGTSRTTEMSKLLYDTYEEGFEFTSDTTMSINFASDKIILDDAAIENFKLPYGIMVYLPIISVSAASTTKIDLASLNTIRSNFISIYFGNKHDEEYSNVLFDYNQEMKENGHFEAYNHWLLMKGNEDEFDEWEAANEEKWSDFIEWYNPNPIDINDSNKFIQP